MSNYLTKRNCGRCRYYTDSTNNLLIGRCQQFKIFVGESEVKPCFSEYRHSSIKVANDTGLVPIDSNPVKEYIVVMDNPNDTVKLLIEQKNKTQDDYKIIYEYIRTQLKEVIQIIDLSKINEVNLNKRG